MKKFDFQVNDYTATQRIEVVKNCNGITITNTGDTAVIIEGITLYPGSPGTILGDSITIGGNEGEILRKEQLVTAFIDPIGTNPKVTVIQKYYI